MKSLQRSSIWLSLVLCLGLSGTAFLAHAQEGSAPSASGADASKAKSDQSPHGDRYQGHHSKDHHAGDHNMGGKGGMHHGMEGHGDMNPGSRIKLDLNEDQLEEIAEIQKKLRSKLTELKAERSEEALKLQELYAADELDAGNITGQQQRVFDLIKEITELQVEAQQDMRNLLTKEQKSKLLSSGDWLMPN